MKVLNRLATSKLALAGLVAGVMLGACDGSAGSGEQSYIERAVQYRAEGKLAAAVIELKNAVQKNPENAEARLLLGELYLQTGDPVSAEKELRRARDLGGDEAETTIPLMQAWIALGKSADVLQALDEPEAQVALAPVDRNTLRGQAYLALGQMADARVEFESAIELEPSEEAYSSLAWIAIIDGQIERAEHYLAEGQAIAPDSANLAMVEGELDLYRKDYEAAESEFRGLVEDNPKNYKALFGLARSQIGGGDIKEAIAVLDGLLKVAPNSPQINYLRAAAAFEEKDYANAQRYADAALTANDSHVPSLQIAGTAAYALGRLEQANDRLSRLVIYDPGNLQARKLLGAVKLRLGRDAEAVETLSAAADSGVADAELLTMAGTAALRTGDRDAASRYFKQASADSTADPDLRPRIALASVSSGDPDQGAQDLQGVLNAGTGAEQSQLQAGAALIQEGRIDEALQIAHDLQARNPSGVGGYLLEGAAHAARQDAAAAISAFETARELAPDNPAVLGNLGEAYRLGGELAKADEVLEKARALAPDDLSILQRQLRLADAQQDAETFERLLQEWIALEPGAVEPRRILARSQLLSNRAEEAYATLQPILPEAGEDPLVREVAGRALQMMGRPADAVEHFEAILEARPEDPTAATLVAEARTAAGDLSGAVDARRRAVSIAPDNQDLRIGLIGTLIAAGEPEAADEEIAALEAITGKTATTEHWRGVAALEDGEDESALEHFQEALALRPATEEAVALARAQWRLDRRDDALETLDQWLAANSEDAPARRQRAMYLIEQGRYDSAQQDYEVLAEIDPDDPTVLNNLAWILSERGKLDEAATYAERALELAPENPAIMDTAGGILSEQGKHDRAIALLSEASEAAPGNPDIRLHHLEALLRAGRRDVAAEVLNDLRTQFPDSQLVSDAETLLKE